MNNALAFDPASLVLAVEPVKEKKIRATKPKVQLEVKITESGVRYHVSTVLSERMNLGLGGNGWNVLVNPADLTQMLINLVSEEGAQLMPKTTSDATVPRKSRNFASHALTTSLLAQGLLTENQGNYYFDLQEVEGAASMYQIIDDVNIDNVVEVPAEWDTNDDNDGEPGDIDVDKLEDATNTNVPEEGHDEEPAVDSPEEFNPEA